jgi:small-conductance mechanosensitive channel
MTFARVSVFILAGSLALASGAALAQLPSIPGLTPPSTKPVGPPMTPEAAKPSDEVMEARLRDRLATARADLARIDSPGGLRAGAPMGTPETELEERRNIARDLVRSYEAQVQARVRLAEAKQQRAAAEAAERDWSGFDEKPPYSILLVEALRTEVASAEARVSAHEAREALLDRFNEATVTQAKEADARARQLAERAEVAKNGPDAERLAWQRDLALGRARALQVAVASREVTERVVSEQLAAARLALSLARKKLALASSDFRFTRADLDKARTTLERERRELERDADAAAIRVETQRKQYDAAQKALAAALAAPARPGETPEAAAARATALERDVALAQARLATASIQVDSLRQEIEAIRIREALWVQRFKSAEDPSLDNRETLRDEAQRVATIARAVNDYVEQQLAIASGQVRDVESRLATSADAAQTDFLRRMQETYIERTTILRRATVPTEAAGALASRVLTELGGAAAERTVTQRVEDGFARARLTARDAWQYELFAVEDTLEIDGEKVVGKTSITVGKILRAIALFVAGYLAARFLASIGERIAVRRFGIDEAQARILRRWLFALGVAILFVVVLIWVRIPLTVFAFLGGAVAIGVGFGMQNLLKNLISGLMVITERPFQVGDVVDVGGVRGTVTNIGIRSSTISDVNGIDTIIPNSTFVEQNLTNWTLENRKVRFSVKVGVAYGSPVKEVERLLYEVAERHGLILDHPAPEVAFEDFGADALMFCLYYWLDLKPDVIARRVATDLRFMIEKSFGEHGIVIAYPQRDVHLDAAKPLEVRVVTGNADTASGTAEAKLAAEIRPLTSAGQKGA